MADGPPTEERDDLPVRQRRPRRRSAADRVRATTFPAAMRGYDRAAVDAFREEVAEIIHRLEAPQPRDEAVKRALEDVGTETSAILQRAHEAAEDITYRSRSQADGRLQRAEQEAEITIREADERAERLEEDARAIWDERARLLEELRQLADEVLGVADDAAERVEPPPGRRPAPEPERDDLGDTDDVETLEDESAGELGQEGEDETDEGPSTGEDGASADDATRTLDATPTPSAASRLTDQPTVESPAARPLPPPPPRGPGDGS